MPAARLTPAEAAAPVWVHPNEHDTGSAFCRRNGWLVGDVLLYSHSADQYGRPLEPERYTILELDCRGHTPCDVRMRHRSYWAWFNMVRPGLRLGPLASSPSVCWPWAKAPVE